MLQSLLLLPLNVAVQACWTDSLGFGMYPFSVVFYVAEGSTRSSSCYVLRCRSFNKGALVLSFTFPEASTRYFTLLAGWLGWAGWLAGMLAGWLDGWLACWLVGWLACWHAGWLCLLAGWQAGGLVGLAGCPAGWLAGWSVDCLTG